MASNRSRSRGRARLSKAEIKAYESRRAAERRRLALRQQEEAEQTAKPSADSTAYTMTRDDEYGVIKSDLVRLGWIVLLLAVMLAAATVLLS